jgi:TfoX/Sxy family transcriptional regulator of competence genes
VRSISWRRCWNRWGVRVLTDLQLAESVRSALAGAGAVREVKMFGGIGFMLNDNLVAAASKRGLLARVGKERQGDALARAGARPMVMRGRAMEGYIYVDPPALTSRAVQAWLRLAVDFVRTLPPKKPRAKRARAKGKRK